MAIITFWSNGKEETAKTLSIAAIATHMAIEHNYRILVLSTGFDDGTLENCFWEPDKNQKFISDLVGKKTDLDSGIEGLAKSVTSGKVSPEIVTDYTKIVFKDRLDVLPGLKTKSYQEYERILPVYQEVLAVANRYYDFVFVDLNKGLSNDCVRNIIDMSDLVVINITHRMKTIEEYIELKQNETLFQKNNTMLLIGRYDKFSKYNTKNISRYIGEKKEISVVPYSTLFFEACNEGKVADFFLRFRKLDPSDRNAIFIEEVKKTTSKILYKIQELQMK